MKKIIYFLIDIIFLSLAIIYLIFKYKKIEGVGWSQKSFEKTIIIANGPSLKLDIKKIFKKRSYSEIYVLNYFAVTKYFLDIKPEYYVLTDRMYWSQNVNDDFKADNEKIFKCLEKVDWKMNLICPESGFQWVKKRLIKNNNIRVIKVHSVNVEFKNENIHLFAINHNITTPNFINGLVMVLWHAIYRKKIDIEIYGADFSLFKEYYVDQKTNDLYFSASHFYKNTDAQKKSTFKYPNEPKKMFHNRLYQQWSSFYQMYLLSKIAKMRNINVINYSSNSFLDCFQRPK